MNKPSKKNAQNTPAIQRPTDLRCEYGENPVGIDSIHPRFSWVLSHAERGQTQSAYQIVVAGSREKLLGDAADLWDSGRVVSDESVNVAYADKPLESAKTYYWKVRWWDNTGQASPFSQPASFETGLLKESDWKAKWIGGGELLRTQFTIDRPFQRARAYICGLGYYELRINGGRVGDHQLDPPWTDYKKLVVYSSYDITAALGEGENAVGVMLGNSRYAHKEYPDTVPVKFTRYENAAPKVILQLELEFGGGAKKKIIVSDASWKVSSGPIVENDIYDGESYDARLEKEGWDSPGYDDSEWAKAGLAEPPGGRLISLASCPPIKAVKSITPLSLSNPRPGVYVYDFGQNFAGRVRLKVSGPRGAEVRLRHAELIDADGMLNQNTNYPARATDSYTLKGEGTEIYEPRFTYHGFRYVEVTGFPGTPTLDSIEGRAIHSAVEVAGGFQCSNSLINNIHHNVIWGQLSNLMGIPTDNCQRTERMGWMGDAQLSAEEAVHNFNMAAFYTKWVRDIKEAQREDGCLPNVVPVYWELGYPADPAWGTAGIVIPWHLYLYYGDRRILEENYPVMKGWVDYLAAETKGYLIPQSELGDWCPPGHDRPVDDSKELVASWYHYQDALTLSQIARIIGKPAEAEKYARLSANIKQAFNKEYIKEKLSFPDLRSTFFVYGTGSQTSHILPLYADMVPEDKRETILNTLLKDIESSHSCHLTTGIVGTRYVLDTLTKYGRADLAYRLATQTTYPSWGYMIREGATTLWERWEYMDGTGMNSHNHIMFGSIDAWFYKVLAGINIDPSRPGFQRFTVKPYILGDLRHASASIQTVRGLVSSSWRKGKDSLILDVAVPVNSQAKVNVPVLGWKAPLVRESGKVIYKDGSYLQGVAGIASGRREDNYASFEVGSGSYSFWIGESP